MSRLGLIFTVAFLLAIGGLPAFGQTTLPPWGDDELRTTNGKRPALAISTNGTMYMAYETANSVDLQVDRSEDGGDSWESYTVINRTEENAKNPDLSTNNGDVFVVHQEAQDVYFTRLKSGGGTIKSEIDVGDASEVETEEVRPRISIDNVNNPNNDEGIIHISLTELDENTNNDIFHVYKVIGENSFDDQSIGDFIGFGSPMGEWSDIVATESDDEEGASSTGMIVCFDTDDDEIRCLRSIGKNDGGDWVWEEGAVVSGFEGIPSNYSGFSKPRLNAGPNSAIVVYEAYNTTNEVTDLFSAYTLGGTGGADLGEIWSLKTVGGTGNNEKNIGISESPVSTLDFRLSYQSGQNVKYRSLSGFNGDWSESAEINSTSNVADASTAIAVGQDDKAVVAWETTDQHIRFNLENTRPSKPTGLSASGTGSGIALSWESNSESDMAGGSYRVHRSTTDGFSPGGGTLVEEVDHTGGGENYTDDGGGALPPPSSGIVYYYKVIAVDEAEAKSQPSIQTEATVSGSPPEAPNELSASQVLADAEKVSLGWNPGGESSPAGYNVYRSTASFTDPDEATKLSSSPLSGTEYTDTEVSSDTDYFYRVTAVGSNGNESPLSGEASVTVLEAANYFTPAGSLTFGPLDESSSAFGDVNGDGNLDLLTTGLIDIDDNSVTTLYLGDGQGGFTEQDAGLTGVFRGSSSFGDVDNDGNLDLLVTGNEDFGDPTATLYLGDGQGGFTEQDAGLTAVAEGSSTFGDVDNDGNLDLVITGSGTATLYLGDGNGGFTEQDAGLTGVKKGSSSFGDVNNDGNLDLVITGDKGDLRSTSTLFRGDGSGDFTKLYTVLTLLDVFRGSSTFGDVDNDGDLDLVLTGFGAPVYLLENIEPGSFLEATATKTVTGDGTIEFVATGAAVQFEGTSGSGDVTVRRFSNGPSNPLGIAESNVSSYRFGISAAGNLTFSDNTEVRLDVSTLEGISDASNVTVYKRPVRGNGQFNALPTSYDAEDNQLVAETGSFSEFVLASSDADNPLPVELVSFKSVSDGDDITLQWTTASETNNAGFAVQHRPDSTASWQKLGFVESKAEGGTATEIHDYRFRADELGVGTHRFRLSQVDTDGTAHHSRVIEASVRMQEAYRLSTYPNPARRQATVELAVRKEQTVRLALYDVLGRRVATLHEGETPAQETKTLRLDVSRHNLPSGAYFLRLRGENGTRTRRLTIVR